jgi:hypothetical protein
MHVSAALDVNWDELEHWDIDRANRLVIFDGGATIAERTERMNATISAYPLAFGYCANKLLPVHDDKGEHVLDMDKAVAETFGIVNYTCHLIGYVNTHDGLRYLVISPRYELHVILALTSYIDDLGTATREK